MTKTLKAETSILQFDFDEKVHPGSHDMVRDASREIQRLDSEIQRLDGLIRNDQQ